MQNGLSMRMQRTISQRGGNYWRRLACAQLVLSSAATLPAENASPAVPLRTELSGNPLAAMADSDGDECTCVFRKTVCSALTSIFPTIDLSIDLKRIAGRSVHQQLQWQSRLWYACTRLVETLCSVMKQSKEMSPFSSRTPTLYVVS